MFKKWLQDKEVKKRKIDSIENGWYFKKQMNPHIEALTISLYYGIIGILWIALTDKILSNFIKERVLYQEVQTYKGWLYVILTMAALYILIRRRAALIHNAIDKIYASYREQNKAYEELTIVEEELREQFEELERHRDALLLSEQRYELATEGANDGIWELDVKNHRYYFSKRWKSTFGYDEKEVKNTYDVWKNLLHPQDRDEAVKKMEEYLHSKDGIYENIYRLKCKDGSYRWILSRGKALRNFKGDVIRVAGSHTDISAYKNMEKQLYQLAYYDILTGLPNRAMFEQTMNEKLGQYKGTESRLALVYMNLDNFKHVNDTWGHVVGNELLKYIANQMDGHCQEHCLCMQLGGDEFAVILDKARDKDEVIERLQALLSAFQTPWMFQEKEVFISFSAGIALYPEDGNDLSTLLINADIAMTRVKEHGKDGYSFYTHDMQAKKLTYIQTVYQLRMALENNEFTVHYQPQVDLSSGKIVALEALVRWEHPEKGMIPPMEFISLAEETGKIHAIGKFVLQTACKQKKKWEEQGYPPISVSVNISGKTLARGDLVELVKQVWEEENIEGKDLQLEITETAVMSDVNTAIESLNELRKIGIRIALDDFGTGYSSLTYLKKLPIDIMKLDREFIRSITNKNNEDNKEVIVQTVIQLANDLGLQVVAEGVESEEQLTFLLQCNCDLAQGYLFSKPMPAKQIEEILKRNHQYKVTG